MYNHEPGGYVCPFCRILREKPEEIIARTEGAAAFLGFGRWGRSPVDVLIVPVEHFENIYDLPARCAPAIHQMTRAAALALKAVYKCEGVSTRQHNEPAGYQDVWHYHLHLIARYTGDNLYGSGKTAFPEVERQAETRKLRDYLRAHEKELFSEGICYSAPGPHSTL